jgi:hypothetical protein
MTFFLATVGAYQTIMSGKQLWSDFQAKGIPDTPVARVIAENATGSDHLGEGRINP